MDNQLNNIEIAIKQDLDNLSSGVRLFHEDEGTNINQITKNILKYSPVSIIFKIQALKELGKTAILLEIEKQLVNVSNKVIPKLTLRLKSHLSSSRNELSGDLPFISEYIELFASTLLNFCDGTGTDQKTILGLEFDNKYFVDEFLDFIKPFVDNLPNKLFIYVLVSAKKLYSKTLRYKLETNYYWDNPSHLGSDLYFLLRNHSSSLIEHLTSSEISTLLRLWSLSDVAIPVGEKALQLLPKYSHQEMGVLLNRKEYRYVINNTDKYEAEHKLYRELAFHYANTRNLEKANDCKNKALSIIDKSSISDTAKIKYRGLIWGDYAQFAKRNLSLNEAINALINQKSIYEADKNLFTNELSLIAYNLGVCYRANRDYKQAIVELSFSIEAENRANNLEGEIEALLEIGKVYIDSSEYKPALLNFEKIKKIGSTPKTIRTEYLRGLALAYIVSIKIILGDRKTAYNIAKEALNIFSRIGAEKDKEQLLELIETGNYHAQNNIY